MYDNSIERAEKLITESAELENPNGLYFLALFSKLNGQTDKYEKLLKDAAEKGSNQALFHIALKENDFSQMKICADRGVENASYIYASKILEYDTNEALWYFMKAAEDGNPKAMVEAAHYLWKSNPEKAEFYLKNAISKSKYPRAYSMYGLYLSTIKGDEKSYSIACASILANLSGGFYLTISTLWHHRIRLTKKVTTFRAALTHIFAIFRNSANPSFYESLQICQRQRGGFLSTLRKFRSLPKFQIFRT